MSSEQKRKKFLKKDVLIIFGIFAILGFFTIKTTYSFFKSTKKQEIANVISTPECLDITLEGTKAINLADQYPISDEEGMNSNPYTFTITNLCNNTSYYQINLESLAESTFNNDSIKVAIDSKKGIYSEYDSSDRYFDDSKDSRKLTTGILKGKNSVTYDLRLWIDENALSSEQNKLFSSKIVVTANLTSITATKDGIKAISDVNKVELNYEVDENNTNTTCKWGTKIGTFDNIVEDATNTNCNINGLESGTTIYYEICTTTEVKGEICDEGAIETLHDAPSFDGDIIAVSNSDSITLTFNANGKSIKKICRYGVEEGKYTENAVIEDNKCLLTNLESNKDYFYEICLNNNGGNVCKTGSMKTKKTLPTTSDIVESVTENSIILDYSGSGDDVNTTCKYGIDEGIYNKEADEVSNTRCSITTNLEEDTTYYYQVCMINDTGEDCKTGSVKTSLLAPSLSLITATSTSDSINLSYSTTGVNTKVVCKYGLDDSYSNTASATNTGCSITNLDEGKNYYYQVCVINDTGEDCKTGSVETSLKPPTLDEIVSTSTSNSINISYASTGSNSIVVCKYGTSEGNYSNEANNITNTGCQITNLEEDTTYYYQVCITNTSGEICKTGNETTLLIPPTISAINATSTSSTINLSYTTTGKNISTICKYGTTEGLYTTNATTVSNSGCSITAGLSPDTTYYYQVCTTNTSGEACKTGSIKTIVAAPTLTSLNATSTSNSISLSYIASGTNIITTCKYGTSSGSYSLNSSSVTNSNCNITNLAPNTTYYYQVCTTNAGGQACKTGFTKTIVAAPTLSNITSSSTTNTITLSYTTTGQEITTTCKWGTSNGNYPNSGTTVSNSGCSITAGLSSGVTYYYQVCVTNAGGQACKEGSIATEKISEPISKVNVGDYVSMTPTSTSYTISKDLTGYSRDQTINPSELNLWRVIKKNEDGTVDIVSDKVSSSLVYFNGSEGYLNLVGGLNMIAAQYTDGTHVLKTRHMGYYNQTLKCSGPLEYSNSNDCNTDGQYRIDFQLVNVAYGDSSDCSQNCSGLKAYKAGSSTYSSYWLASRSIGYTDSNWYYDGTIVDDDGGWDVDILYIVRSDGSDIPYSRQHPVRPIVTLKSTSSINDGSGTSSSPYTLN